VIITKINKISKAAVQLGAMFADAADDDKYAVEEIFVLPRKLLMVRVEKGLL
jgi:hypothetical protein